MPKPLKRVCRDASLHPTTVSEAAKHLQKRTRKAAPRNPVTIVKVDLRVWRKALELAGREISRIEVISPTNVIVHNPGWKKK